MAKVGKNIVIQGISGSLGDQLVIQGGKGGQTIIRTKPTPSSKEPTPAQQATRERFQEATAYGKAAKDRPAYAEKAAGTPQTTYNVAVADWFHAPEVDEVDLSALPVAAIHYPHLFLRVGAEDARFQRCHPSVAIRATGL